MKISKAPSPDNPACKACALCRSCRSPFMLPVRMHTAGKLVAPILIVGEQPTEADDFDGELLSRGRSERSYALLLSTLKAHGVQLHQCVYTTAVLCAPAAGTRETTAQKVGSKHINACREFLLRTVERVRPVAVLALGNNAMRALWKKSGVTKARRTVQTLTLSDGTTIPACVAFSPSYPLRDANQMSRFVGDIKYFAQHVLTTKKKKALTHVVLNPTCADIQQFHRNAVSKNRLVAFDVETDELLVYTRRDWKMLCIGLSDGYKTYVVEFDKCNAPTVGRTAQLIATQCAVLDVLRDPKVKKVAHNCKYDMHAVAQRFGFNVRGVTDDTMVLHAHCYPITGGHDLKGVASDLLGVHEYTADLKGYVNDTTDLKRYGKVPYEVLGTYCGYDVYCTVRVAQVLHARLRSIDTRMQRDGVPWQSSTRAYRRVIMPALLALYRMERRGIRVNVVYAASLSAQLRMKENDALQALNQLPRVQRWVRAQTDLTLATAQQKAVKPLTKERKAKLRSKCVFKPNSSPHVTELTYGADYYACQPTKTTAQGKPTTGKDMLVILARTRKLKEFSRFVELLRDCKRHKHYRTTYVDGVRKFLSPTNDVHPSTRVYGAETARISCADPNIQNIPRDDEMRNVFTARPGYRLVDGDYSQIELRVLAALSGDANMIDVYKNNRDLHTETAMHTYGHSNPKDVTKEQRQSCKPVNFGVVYQVGAPKLAEQLTEYMERPVTPDEAQSFIDALFEAYPSVLEWQMETKAFAASHGYVYTMLGTQRLLANATLKGSDYEQRRLREEAFRQACNTPIQGTAGLLALAALTRLTKEYRKRKLPARVVCTVHDSIVTEAKEDVLDEVIELKNKIMSEEPVRLLGDKLNGVPIVAEFKVGKSWGACTEWKGGSHA